MQQGKLSSACRDAVIAKDNRWHIQRAQAVLDGHLPDTGNGQHARACGQQATSWAVPCHCPSPRCSRRLFPQKNLPITDGQAWCGIADQPRLAVWRVSTRSLRLARKAAATPSSGRGPGTGAEKRLMVVVEGPNWPLKVEV
jgi:hypothetical protein